MLTGRKILVGVTGSIAAYKSAVLIRLLVREGAEVRVVMTDAARQFITPLTLSTLSKGPVYGRFYDPESGTWESHVDLGLWADLFLIAPISANTLAKLAQGICDNLLTAIYLSARCPVYLAPAMDLDMYRHPATRRNIDQVSAHGACIIDAEYGELASGLQGEGRMAEPEHIVKRLAESFRQPLHGIRALVTAGPTHEPIDPVRYIGNNSSGKMGFAIADRLAELGADVQLVSGPSQLRPSHPRVELIRVQQAGEMYEACSAIFDQADYTVLAAAVADYRPASVALHKIKKDAGSRNMVLEPTVDIAKQLGKRKRDGQIIVGFALETEREKENAREKMKRKNFDLIVLNSLRDEGAGFGCDTNRITIFDRRGREQEFPMKSKKEVAVDIVNALMEYAEV